MNIKKFCDTTILKEGSFIRFKPHDELFHALKEYENTMDRNMDSDVWDDILELADIIVTVTDTWNDENDRTFGHNLSSWVTPMAAIDYVLTKEVYPEYFL